MEFDAYLDRISERNVGRYDVPALFEEGPVLDSVVDDLAAPFRDGEIDAVAGIDALGFVLGTGVALDVGVGFVPVRKGGKLSVPESDVLRRAATALPVAARESRRSGRAWIAFAPVRHRLVIAR